MKPLFVHIPKTGGMTIRRGIPDRIVTANGDNHISRAYTAALAKTMSDAGEHHGFEHARIRDWSKALRSEHPAVAIVRNPWDRVVSRYLFARVTDDKSGKKSFEQFLHERHQYGGLKYYWHRAIRGWYPQKDYVVDEAGELQVDCLRFGTDDYLAYFNLNKHLPIRNVSNTGRRDYRLFYNQDTRDIVGDWYQDDIDFFGFTFAGPAKHHLWADR